ncbi:MAG: amidohydrolase family protein, partial [Candidatus Aureabacteria bacterium]|nr:amidohydrolase family protein [Candidatus Auribacterota bacterium]
LHPDIVKLVLAVVGKDRVVLVTDCMEALGMVGGEEMRIGGRAITVRGGAPQLDDGTLCGSILTMNRAVENIIAFTGMPVADAVRLATMNPARAIGIEARKGTLAPGKDADLVIFDEAFDIKTAIIGGSIVHNTL